MKGCAERVRFLFSKTNLGNGFRAKFHIFAEKPILVKAFSCNSTTNKAVRFLKQHFDFCQNQRFEKENYQ